MNSIATDDARERALKQTDHAAALAVLDRITPGKWRFEPTLRYVEAPTESARLRPADAYDPICCFTGYHHGSEANARAIAALPELAALYRAGVELQNANNSWPPHRSDPDVRTAHAQRMEAAEDGFRAALAAVADALTQGEGK